MLSMSKLFLVISKVLVNERFIPYVFDQFNGLIIAPNLSQPTRCQTESTDYYKMFKGCCSTDAKLNMVKFTSNTLT